MDDKLNLNTMEDLIYSKEKSAELRIEIEEFFKGNRESNKSYNRESICYKRNENEEILEDVRKFFQDNLKIILEGNTVKKNNKDSCIELFKLEKKNTPIYENFTGDNMRQIQSIFINELERIIEELYKIIDNNILDINVEESIESYVSVIEKCENVYNNQWKRRMRKFNGIEDYNEIKENIKDLFCEILDRYMIKVLMDALYERIKNSDDEAYIMVLDLLNNFLENMGVYTIKVLKGDKIDFEYMEATYDSSTNITDDSDKYETISDIKRYPYYFDDDTRITDGLVKIWRSRD